MAIFGMMRVSQNVTSIRFPYPHRLYWRIHFVACPSPKGSERSVPRDADDPIAHMMMVGAFLSGVLLVLRHSPAGPGVAVDFGRQVALLAGPLGCLIVAGLVSVLMVLPLFAQRSFLADRLLTAAAPALDAAVTLAVVLSVVAAIGALVAVGRPALAFGWFASQAVIAWGCYKLRLRAIAP